MTYKPHVLLSFGGTIRNDEVWSSGLRIDFGGPIAALLDRMAFCNTNIDDIAGDVVSFVTSTDSHLSNQVKLRYVKLNPIGADGRYEDSSVTVAKFYDSGTIPTGTGIATMPNQISLVVTLETGATRGRAHRGRMFVPALNIGIDGQSGLMVSPTYSDIGGKVKDLINGVNNLPGIDVQDPQVSVFSRLGDPGPVKAVTGVSVDSRVDVQRRRANNQAGVRAAIPL